MARSPAERLASVEQLRDKVEGALLSGAPVVSYSLDGQMVTKEPTTTWLATLDAIIADLRRQAGSGMAASRNLVRFR